MTKSKSKKRVADRLFEKYQKIPKNSKLCFKIYEKILKLDVMKI